MPKVVFEVKKEKSQGRSQGVTGGHRGSQEVKRSIEEIFFGFERVKRDNEVNRLCSTKCS